MSKLIKNERNGRYDEYPPYKCKLCAWAILKLHTIFVSFVDGKMMIYNKMNPIM